MERERDRPLACKFPGQSGKPVRIADFEENTQRGGERPELPRRKKSEDATVNSLELEEKKNLASSQRFKGYRTKQNKNKMGKNQLYKTWKMLLGNSKPK